MKTNKIPLMLTIISLFSLSAVSAYGWTRDEKNLFKSLSKKFINQDIITYCVSVDPDSNSNNDMTLDDLSEQFETAFKEWTKGVKGELANSMRAEEFGDVIRLLNKNIKLEKIGECPLELVVQKNKIRYFNIKKGHLQPDIGIIYSPVNCLPRNNFEDYVPDAFYFNAGSFNYICIRNGQNNSSKYEDISSSMRDYISGDNDKFGYKFFDSSQTYVMILHELGHSFGLLDEYNTDRKNYPSTKKPGQGVMNKGRTEITWDEIEGLVSIFDKLNNIERKYATLRNIKLRNNKAVIINGEEVFLESGVL